MIIFCLIMIISGRILIYFFVSVNLVSLMQRIELIYCIFVFLLCKSCYCLFFIELWHFKLDLVWGDSFVGILLLLHCFLFIANTAEIVAIAAVWIFVNIFHYHLVFIEPLLFVYLYIIYIFWDLLFLSIDISWIAYFNNFFNLTWIFFMSFLAAGIPYIHL